MLLYFLILFGGVKPTELLDYRLLYLGPWSRAYSSVGLERSPDKGKVSGSNPLRPTILRPICVKTRRRNSGGVAQLGERGPCKAEVSGSIPLISISF